MIPGNDAKAGLFAGYIAPAVVENLSVNLWRTDKGESVMV